MEILRPRLGEGMVGRRGLSLGGGWSLLRVRAVDLLGSAFSDSGVDTAVLAQRLDRRADEACALLVQVERHIASLAVSWSAGPRGDDEVGHCVGPALRCRLRVEDRDIVEPEVDVSGRQPRVEDVVGTGFIHQHPSVGHVEPHWYRPVVRRIPRPAARHPLHFPLSKVWPRYLPKGHLRYHCIPLLRRRRQHRPKPHIQRFHRTLGHIVHGAHARSGSTSAKQAHSTPRLYGIS